MGEKRVRDGLHFFFLCSTTVATSAAGGDITVKINYRQNLILSCHTISIHHCQSLEVDEAIFATYPTVQVSNHGGSPAVRTKNKTKARIKGVLQIEVLQLSAHVFKFKVCKSMQCK